MDEWRNRSVGSAAPAFVSAVVDSVAIDKIFHADIDGASNSHGWGEIVTTIGELTEGTTYDIWGDGVNVAKRLQEFVGDSGFQLVETLAEKVAGIVRDEFGVAWVRVRVNKPGAIRGARDVGVIIERGVRPDAG